MKHSFLGKIALIIFVSSASWATANSDEAGLAPDDIFELLEMSGITCSFTASITADRQGPKLLNENVPAESAKTLEQAIAKACDECDKKLKAEVKLVLARKIRYFTERCVLAKCSQPVTREQFQRGLAKAENSTSCVLAAE